jgi:hypothetical protein
VSRQAERWAGGLVIEGVDVCIAAGAVFVAGDDGEIGMFFSGLYVRGALGLTRSIVARAPLAPCQLERIQETRAAHKSP